MTQPAEIVIDEGRFEDAAEIVAFQCRMAHETEDKILDKAVVTSAVTAVFQDPTKGFYVVARDGEALAACVLITYEWSDWRNSNLWYFQSVYVASEYRRRGIFSQIYSEVVNRAKKAGAMFVRLYVEKDNERAQRTYEKLGMTKMPYLMYDVKIG